MFTYVSIKPLDWDFELSDAIFSEKAEKLHLVCLQFSKIREEVVNFTKTSLSGTVLCDYGDFVLIECPIGKVVELPPFLKKIEASFSLGIAIGMGSNTMEAFKAMCISEAKMGESVELYSSETEEVFSELHKSEDEHYSWDMSDLHKDDEVDDDSKKKLLDALAQVKENSQAIAQLKQSNPDAYNSIKKIVDAMIHMAQQQGKQKEENAVDELPQPSTTAPATNVQDRAPQQSGQPQQGENTLKTEVVGSIDDHHRMKVESRNEMTRAKEAPHRHRMSAGMALSSSGHPVSANRPDNE